MNVHKSVRDLYSRRFTELESIVLNPVDYARAVKIIGNVDDLTKVTDQLSFLPNNTIMSASVAFSASTGKPLSDKDQEEVIRGCDEILFLD
jgi:U4/U6 small nuclear ribonucleoprotein PRP31